VSLDLIDPRRRALDGVVAPDPVAPVTKADQTPSAYSGGEAPPATLAAGPLTPLGAVAPSGEPVRIKPKRSARRDKVGKADQGSTVGTSKPMFSIGQTVKPAGVMAFSRQLSSFLEAGIPVLGALEIVGLETGSPVMRAVIADIRLSIQRGSSFVGAVDRHPEVFPAYYRAMLVSAEFTGHLDEVLSLLAGYIERDITARRQIKSALSYPILVLCLAVVAMIVMSIFVLPKFSGLYRGLGAELPLPTRMLIGFTDFVTNQWPMILGSMAVVVVVLIATVGGDRGKGRRDIVTMKLPVVGHLFQLISLERFCRVLSALANSGAPLPDAITVSADSTNNSIFQSRMLVVRETLIRGSGLYAPMVASGIFPLAARQMIQVGEKTGSLGDQLAKAANYYEREVAFKMKKATDMFQPMVILFVGLVVGFVAVAQVAAMYSIFGQVK
jgi:type IV pilus assembly protein PilC